MNNGFDNFENKNMQDGLQNPEAKEPETVTEPHVQPEPQFEPQTQAQPQFEQPAQPEPQPEQPLHAQQYSEPEKREEPAQRSEYHYTGSQMGGFGRETFGADRNTYGNGGSYTYRGVYGNDANKGFYNSYRSDTENHQYAQQNANPYTAQNNRNQYPPYNNVYAQHEVGKPEKQKKGVGAGVLAIVCCLTVLISAVAGFAGASVFYRNSKSANTPVIGGGDGSTVIDRVVESGEASTGEKGVYTDVAAAVKDSVVEITTEFQVTGFFQYVSEGAGSGVIISEDGYVITNNHVISDTSTGEIADSITVRLTNGHEYTATLVGKDADSDVAVVKITPDEKLSYAVFGDSDKLVVGEEVLAVGNPLGELGGTVTNGIISALDREMEVDGTTMNLLQTNAAVNPGNSGGGLFNMKGELIGVVNAKSSGSGIEGLGFAIPSNDAHRVAKELIENGYVTGKVYLGVSFVDITDPYTAYRYFKSQATGVYVVELSKGYNEKVLKKGDRIVAIDGNEITAFSQIKDILKKHSVGDELEFTLYRGGKLTSVNVKCYEYKPENSGSVDFDE